MAVLTAATIIAAIGRAMALIPTLVQAGKDTAPVAKLIYDTWVLKKEPTWEDLDKFNAETDKLAEELDAPLPDEKT